MSDDKIIDLTDIISTDFDKWSAEERRNDRAGSIRTLAGGIAHDLNNILAVTVGLKEIYLMDDNIPEDARKLIERLNGEELKIRDYLNRLVGATRPQNIEPAAIDMNELVGNLSGRIDYTMINNAHDIKLDLASYIPTSAGLTGEISDAAMAIISNAAANSKDGSKITISTKEEVLARVYTGYETIPEGRYVELKVADEGPEIPKEDLDRIFEPYRNKDRLKQAGPMGLDMTIAYRTVKTMGGYVDLKREDGKNSISFYFPQKEGLPKQKEIGKDSIVDYMGKGETVMVVDDDDSVRDITAIMLNEIGYEVLTASSGAEAVNYVANNPVDLLVLDMQMPGMDGAETYRKIIQGKPDQRAIVLSGYAKSDRLDEAVRLGVGDVIEKPIKLEVLGAAIRTELDR